MEFKSGLNNSGINKKLLTALSATGIVCVGLALADTNNSEVSYKNVLASNTTFTNEASTPSQSVATAVKSALVAKPAVNSSQSPSESITNSPVVFESISDTESGSFIKSKVVKTDYKFPHIRVVEHFETDVNNQEKMHKQSFMVADHLTVKLQENVNIDTLAALIEPQGYEIRKAYQNSNVVLVSFPLENANSLEQAQAFLAQHSHAVAYAEADYLRFLTSVTPNDASYSKQSYLYFQRKPDNLNYGVDSIGAAQAWDRRTDAIKDNGEYIKVGVIDTALHMDHEDLVNNLWENPNEIAGNGIDDDNNGYIDDTHGWNINENSNVVQVPTLQGHGTHVAGIIAAEGNNEIGVTGVAWKAKLIPAVIYGTNYTSGAESAEAIRYLTGLGVDVMNASYGSSDYTQVECDAIEEANDAGVLFVTSAGNNTVNLDLDGNDQFPAECDVANIITVGGGVTSGQSLDFGASNYGALAVDIIAPFHAYSTYNWDATYPSDSYAWLEGTSMSSPMVAGSAALLMAEHPSLSHLEIKALLMDNASKASSISNMSQSGMLNLSRAMNYDVATSPAVVSAIYASTTDGNLADNAMDGDTSTRWSAFGVGETITFELSEASILSAVDVQWLKGDQRAAKFSIESSMDGVEWEGVFGGLSYGDPLEQSSGSSAELEHYPVQNIEAQYVRITGYGNTANDWNSIIETVIYVYDDSPVTTVLYAPSDLSALESDSAVELTWVDETSGEDGYEVYRSDNGGSWEPRATLSGNSESFTDTAVAPGSTYEYTVNATLGAQSGPDSDSVSITLEDVVLVELNAPTNLSANENNAAVELTWNDQSTGEESYEIYRSDNGGSWEPRATVSANSESFTDTAVAPGSTYEYIVRAFEGVQGGPDSATVSITLEDSGSTSEKLVISGVSASTDDGNVPENTLDGSTSTRWSANGDGQWIEYNLGGTKTITAVDIAFFKGNQRSSNFTLSVQSNNGGFVEIYNGSGNGESTELETFSVDAIEADTLRYTGYGNSSNSWNSVTEVEVYGY